MFYKIINSTLEKIQRKEILVMSSGLCKLLKGVLAPIMIKVL